MIEKMVSGGFSTNTYIISNDKRECIIVDPTLDFERTYKFIINNYKPKAILLTHAHIDHIDGLKYFTELPIYIYKDEMTILLDNDKSLYAFFSMKNPFLNKQLDLRLIEDGDIINLIGYDFEVISTPGHTIGSVCYYYNDGLLTGDTLFSGSIGRTDFPTGDYEQIIKSIDHIVKLFDKKTVCYPGHGPSTTIEKEVLSNPFLK